MSDVDEARVLDDGSARFVTGVSAFFATMYFIQGIGDPTSGLIAQPVRSLLSNWGESPSEIGAFMALLSLPWMIKPLFALLSDLVPLFGSHRRNYLLLSCAIAVIGLLVLYSVPLPAGTRWLLFFWLLLPTIGIAFGDVLVDALMVEVGQPRGLTGRLQSIQWTAVSAALCVAGAAGGFLSRTGHHEIAFLVCALLWIASFVLALRFARESPRPSRRPGDRAREAASGFVAALRVPGLSTVCMILFLWSFNPSWVSVQYLHVTAGLGLGEQAFGNSGTAFNLGCLAAGVCYGFYCRRVPMGRLVHVAIAMGVLGYAVCIELSTPTVLYEASFVSGVANMTGNLVLLDVAARLVPIRVAATCFALLMAISNVAAGFSEWLGTEVYEVVGAGFGENPAYRVVVVTSAMFAASCWLLVPRLRREVPQWWSDLAR